MKRIRKRQRTARRRTHKAQKTDSRLDSSDRSIDRLFISITSNIHLHFFARKKECETTTKQCCHSVFSVSRFAERSIDRLVGVIGDAMWLCVCTHLRFSVSSDTSNCIHKNTHIHTRAHSRDETATATATETSCYCRETIKRQAKRMGKRERNVRMNETSRHKAEKKRKDSKWIHRAVRFVEALAVAAAAAGNEICSRSYTRTHTSRLFLLFVPLK